MGFLSGSVRARILLFAALAVLSTAAGAVTVGFNSPSNGLVVTRGQVVGISVSFFGSVAGVQSVQISGAGDADGTDDFYSYGTFPPKTSGTVSGSYTVPNTATNGQHLTLTATVTDYVDGPFSTSIDLVASVSGGGSPPGNDNFANAISLSGASGSTTGNNANATKETGEPNHAGNSGGHSVWWKWTAPSSKRVQIDTKTSNFDTILGIYTGTTVNSLTTIASDDESGGSFTSLVQFNPVAGTTYYIAVDGWAGATGNVVLSWSQGLDDVINIGVDIINQTYDPVRNRFYGVNSTNSRIEVIDPDIPAVIGNLPTPGKPNGVAITPDGSKMIVAQETSQTISVIDLNTSSVIQTTSTVGVASAGPRQLGTITNDFVLVGIGNGTIEPPLLYTISTNRLKKLPLNGTNWGGVFTGGADTPHQIATSPVRNRGMLADTDALYAFDNQPTQTARMYLGFQSRDIDVSPSADRYMAVDTNAAPDIRIMDGSLNVLLTVTSSQIGGGGYIRYARFLPDPRFIAVFIANYPSPATLKIIRSSTGEVVSSKNLELDSFDALNSIWMTVGKSNAGDQQQIIFVDRSSSVYKIWFTKVPANPTGADSDWVMYE